MTRTLQILAIASVLAAFAAGAYAAVETVIVTPSNPGDWSWAVNTATTRDKAYFTRGGPAPAEGNPIPTGNGAFYAWLGWEAGDYVSTPASAWLGLDRFKGQSLAGIRINQIKRLEYTTYVSGLYNMNASGALDYQRRYPRQPFMVTLTTYKPNSTTRRQLMLRPWGHVNRSSDLGNPFQTNRRQWFTVDAINMFSDPDHMGLGWKAPRWYCWYLNNNNYPDNDFENGIYANWDEVLAKFGTQTLVPTSTAWDPGNGQYKSAGWDNTTVPVGDWTATATGKCINLWVGARKAGNTELPSWINESMNFAGYVDTFTLGIDLNNDGELDEDTEVVTYDFASDDPEPVTVAVCNTGISRWSSNPPFEFPYASYRRTMDDHFPRSQANQHQFLYRFFGQVQDLTYSGGGPAYDDRYGTGTGEFYFTIWDGTYANVSTGIEPSGKLPAYVQVRLPWYESSADPEQWPVKVGDFVSVKGFLYDRFYSAGNATPPPTEITANAGNIVVYHTEPEQ